MTATVSQLSGELTYSNNSTTITVRVLDNKPKFYCSEVCLIPTFRRCNKFWAAIRRSKSRLLFKKRPTNTTKVLPSSLSNFDLLILSGFPDLVLHRPDVQKVARSRKSGESRILFYDWAANQSKFKSSDVLGDVLPVKPTVVRNSVTEASFFHRAVAQFTLFWKSATRSPKIGNCFRPCIHNQSRWELAGDARILASPQVNGVVLPDPLLVVRTRGRIRSAALLGSGIFRWRSLPADLASLTHFLPSITSNTLRWVTSCPR